jgi:dipeptide/tripeptide permease
LYAYVASTTWKLQKRPAIANVTLIFHFFLTLLTGLVFWCFMKAMQTVPQFHVRETFHRDIAISFFDLCESYFEYLQEFYI